MPKLLLSIGLLTSVVSALFAQTTPKAGDQNATIQESVLQLIRDWRAAEEHCPKGNTVSKDDVLPAEGSQSGGLSISTSDLKARVFGDTAVVTARRRTTEY